MPTRLTLRYWIDDGWYVGRLKEVPGVFSQGETLEELEENIRDAYELVTADAEDLVPENAQTKLVDIGGMKRQKLIRELEAAGCRFTRSGGRHDLYLNPANGKKAPVPRHNEIKDDLCRVIRKQLGLT